MNIGFGELIMILLVAFLVVGPKDLPKVARWLGRQVRMIRRMICFLCYSVYSRNRENPRLCDPSGLSSQWVTRAIASPAILRRSFPCTASLCVVFYAAAEKSFMRRRSGETLFLYSEKAVNPSAVPRRFRASGFT